jgi:hypothetical protein
LEVVKAMALRRLQEEKERKDSKTAGAGAGGGRTTTTTPDSASDQRGAGTGKAIFVPLGGGIALAGTSKWFCCAGSERVLYIYELWRKP